MFDSTGFSPLQIIEDDLLRSKGITLCIKRDDLLHGACQGNKFRKLKHHLIQLQQKQNWHLLTFGGPFSNHIYATAAAGFHFQIKTTGLIRGELDDQNPTLKKVREWGMDLVALDRNQYQRKSAAAFIESLRDQYPDAYLVPEGGHHALAQLGVSELVDEVRSQFTQPIDRWACPYGTGSTLLGIARKMVAGESVTGYVVLKGFDLIGTRKELMQNHPNVTDNLHLVNAHYGGYARRNSMVEEFIMEFYHQHQILLDPVYTAKMFLQIYSEVAEGSIKEGTTMVVIHTGGLQGLAGYNYRYRTKLPEWHMNGL